MSEPPQAQESAWTACRSCDTLHRLVEAPPHCVARCRVCGTKLYHGQESGLSRPLAISLAGLLLYFPANLLPVMKVSLFGEVQESTLTGGALSLWQGGFPLVAALVLLVGVVLPLLKLMSILYVAGPLERGRAAPGARAMFRLHEHFTDWGMLEVYLLGLLISVVKLREIVEIETGAGLLCFGGTVLLVVLLSVWLDPEDVWRRLKSAKPLG